MSIFFATKTEGARASVSVPLYLAGAIAQCSALTVVANQLNDMFFSNLTVGLTLVGFAAAYGLRRIGATSRLLRVASVGLAFLAFFFLSGRGLVPEVGGDFRHVSERLLISTLAFVASVASFFLVTDESVAFVGVWGIAIIGLAGTTDVNLPLIVSFAIFLLAVVFLLVHLHALSQARPSLRPELSRGGLLLYQGAVSLGLWGIVIALGVAVSIPLRMVGKNLSLAAVVNQLKVTPESARRRGPATLGRLTEGGGQFAVGLGPIRDDKTPVMQVWSDEPRHWRGHTYDVWGGHGWVTEQFRAGVELQPARTEGADRVFDIPPRPDAIRGKTRSIRYRVLASSPTVALIYQVGDTQRVKVGTDSLFQTAEGGIGAFTYLTGYSVEGTISEATPAELNASPAEYPDAIRRRYLAIERTPALIKLAEEATAGKTGPYERAEAIRMFVANRCLYTLEARRVPDDRDAVEFFLNDSKEGYCDLYASAVAVLCRVAGIPSRIATGFNSGEPDPSAPGAFLLRESHRHAWAEVYFEGFGWQVLDATQDTGLAADGASRQGKAGSSWAQLLQRAGGGPAILVALGLLGLLVGSRSDVLFRWGRGIHPGSVEARRIHTAYRAALRQAGRNGAPRAPSDTAREHLGRVRATLGGRSADAFAPLVALQEKTLYTPIAPTAADADAAAEALKRFRDALRERKG